MVDTDESATLPSRTLTSLAVVTAGALAFQVLLTRVLSAVLAYHFSFLAVSLSLVGTGAGAMFVYLRPDRFVGPVNRHLSSWSFWFGTSLVVLPMVLVRMNLGDVQAAAWPLRLALVCLLVTIPPFAAGVVVALALSRFAERIGAVYGSDLLGAGIGALLAVPLMWWAPAPHLIVVVGILGVAAAWGFCAEARHGRTAIVGGFGGAILALSAVSPVLQLPSGYDIPPGTLFVERWTPLSRVIGLGASEGQPFGQVLYDRVYAPVPVVSEGATLTWRELQTGLQSIAYRFSGPGRTLIIGGGGGRDIHNALSERQSPIEVIELNRGIVRVVDEDLASISGSPYSMPGVETEVGDGRSILAARTTLYDHIHLGFTDTLSANAAQGFALMENNLYTVEAFLEYFAHLAPNGILSVSRLYDFVGPEVLRLTVLAIAALRERGVSNPRDHLFVMRGTELGGAEMGTLLARLDPFDTYDLKRLRFLARLRGGEVVYAPDDAVDGEWLELAESTDEMRFCRQHRYDVCPPTDDRPFFFNMDWKLSEDRDSDWFWRGVTPFSILLVILAVLTALSVLAFVVPLALARGSLPPLAMLAYFAMIGLGYILVEIVLIQHFVLFLGFPTYALSVVLAGLLLSSGVGAFASARVSTGAALSAVLASAAVLLWIGAVALQPSLRSMIGLGLAERVGLALLLLAPVGGLLGFAMPLGLRRLEEIHPGGIPYAWGINGIASVLGSVLGVVIAMLYGFKVTGMTAAACYAGALAMVGLFGRRRAAD